MSRVTQVTVNSDPIIRGSRATFMLHWDEPVAISLTNRQYGRVFQVSPRGEPAGVNPREITSGLTPVNLSGGRASQWTFTFDVPNQITNIIINILANRVTPNNPLSQIHVANFQSFIDAIVPTISFDTTELISGVPANANIGFPIDATGLTASDFSVTGGTRGALTSSGRNYALRVTPTARQDGTLTVSLPANAIVETNNPVSVSIRYARPTFTINIPVAQLAWSDSVTVLIACSFSTTDFTANDVEVVNGIKGAFSGSGVAYSLLVTAPASGQGDIVVRIPANVIPQGNVAVQASVPYRDLALLLPIFPEIGPQFILLDTPFRLDVPIQNDPDTVELFADYKGVHYTRTTTGMSIFLTPDELFTDVWKLVARNSFGYANPNGVVDNELGVPALIVPVEVVQAAPVISDIPRLKFYIGQNIRFEVSIINSRNPIVRGLAVGLSFGGTENGVVILGQIPADAVFTRSDGYFTVTDTYDGGSVSARGEFDLVTGTPPAMTTVSKSGSTFTWTAVPDALSYAYAVGVITDDSTWIDVGNVLTYTIETLQDSDTVHWRVNSPWLGEPYSVYGRPTVAPTNLRVQRSIDDLIYTFVKPVGWENLELTYYAQQRLHPSASYTGDGIVNNFRDATENEVSFIHRDAALASYLELRVYALNSSGRSPYSDSVVWRG